MAKTALKSVLAAADRELHPKAAPARVRIFVFENGKRRARWQLADGSIVS